MFLFEFNYLVIRVVGLETGMSVRGLLEPLS